MRTWMQRRRFASPTAPARERRRFRPSLEVLEDRALLATGFYQQTILAADQPGVGVLHAPGLINTWGISLSSAGGAFWVSSFGAGTSPLFIGDVNGQPIAPAFTVSIPGGMPTGQVFNASSNFVVRSGTSSGQALFIFASTGGQITGWNPAVPPPFSVNAQPAVSTPGAVYTGLAIGNNGSGNFLYAADFQGGKIDVFDGNFAPATLAGNFTANIPPGFVPFNIQNLAGKLYVTYAVRGPGHHGEIGTRGAGVVAVFDLNGNFLQRLAGPGHLRAPWGLALAPADFGDFSNALLVGNHGNGRIHAFNPTTGAFLGELRGESGPIRIDGLFGLAFGNGVSAGDSNALYFAAGPDRGTHGWFGSIRFVAAPSASGFGASVASLLVANKAKALVVTAPPAGATRTSSVDSASIPQTLPTTDQPPAAVAEDNGSPARVDTGSKAAVDALFALDAFFVLS